MDTPITSFNGGKGQEEAPEGVGGGQGKMNTQITNFNGGKGQKKAPKGGGTNGRTNAQTEGPSTQKCNQKRDFKGELSEK